MITLLAAVVLHLLAAAAASLVAVAGGASVSVSTVDSVEYPVNRPLGCCQFRIVDTNTVGFVGEYNPDAIVFSERPFSEKSGHHHHHPASRGEVGDDEDETASDDDAADGADVADGDAGPRRRSSTWLRGRVAAAPAVAVEQKQIALCGHLGVHFPGSSCGSYSC